MFLSLNLVTFYFSYYNSTNISPENLLASVFFTDSSSTDYLKNNYNKSEKKIKILVVPGHDEVSSGTQYKGAREANLTSILGNELISLLQKDNRFEIILSRDGNLANPQIKKYLENNKDKIENFTKDKKALMNDLILSGSIATTSGVSHVSVGAETANRLYGTNMWANENEVELILHIHLNDYPKRKLNMEGKYSGFSIYVPEPQYSNSKSSTELANYVFKELKRFYPISNMPKENSGVISDQELIAIGAYNTLNPASMLIEYGYIYESQFTNEKIRNTLFKDMAYQTYLGITRFFNKQEYGKNYWKTTLLPYYWDTNLSASKENISTLSLQSALTLEGVYPPKKYTKNECPITGSYKQCTVLAIKEFQKKYGIDQSGRMGPRTLKKLNDLYSKIPGD